MADRVMPSVEGVRHRFVTVRGVRFHVAEAGEGEPVLLLHGYPQHWFAWRHVVPLLAGRYRLIMPDLRGFGWSEAPWGGYSTSERVSDVLALMDELGLEQTALVGHEWGGWLGFMACLRAPERFSAFLALNITHPWPDQRAMRRTAWRMWFTAFLEYPLVGEAVVRWWPGFTRFLLRYGVADCEAWSPEVAEEYVQALRPLRRAHASRALHWQFVLHDIPRLALRRYHRQRLSVPTILLFGEKDFALSPRVLAGGEQHADHLDIKRVPGCGHYLPEEHPALVAATVQGLFTRPQTLVTPSA